MMLPLLSTEELAVLLFSALILGYFLHILFCYLYSKAFAACASPLGMSQSRLLELPAELLTHILSYLEADDVIAFSRTGSKAHKFIAPHNTTLWKQTFLNSYDNPEHAWHARTKTMREANKDVEDKWDWYFSLCQRRNLTRLVNGKELISMIEDYTEVVCVLLDMVDTANPKPNRARHSHVDNSRSANIDILAEMSSRGQNNLERIIHSRQMESFVHIPPRSGHIGRPVTRSTLPVIVQPDGAARLHLLHGMTEMEKNAPRLRGAARRLVYNWSLTGAATDYGPFRLDGSGQTNWQLLEGVCSTISRNFHRCADGKVIMPDGFQYNFPYRTLMDPTVPEDWAGAHGAWLGTYAFLDYADLFQFNTGPGHRSSLDDEPEACGDLMRLELKLDPGLRNDYKLQTNLPICEDLPMLFFSGESKGHDGAYRPSIGVRGTVSLVPGGREVRWRYFINYGGADQWQLEGVQPGGIRSGGVYGLWSHCDHAENGPVGPFCYFPDELCKKPG